MLGRRLRGDGNDPVAITAYEVAGVTGAAQSAVDSGDDNGTAISTGAITTTNSNDFVVAGAVDAAESLSADSGWGDFEGQLGYPFAGTEDQFITSSGSVTGTMTASGSSLWAAAIAAFDTSGASISAVGSLATTGG